VTGRTKKDGALFVRLEPVESLRKRSRAVKPFQQMVTADAQDRVSFLVPETQMLGEYNLGVVQGADESVRDGVTVTLARGSTAPIVVRSAHAVNRKGSFDVTLLGEGFSEVAEDNFLVFEGLDEIAARATDSSSTHLLQFEGIPGSFAGLQHIRLRIGDQYSQDPATPLVLADYTGRALGIAAALVTLIAFVLTVVVTSRGLQRAVIAGVPKSVATTFLLDAETDSYSLSKLQFYLWTGAAIFGYLYMLLVRSLIQGSFEFPEIPTNLPGVLLISGSTSIVAKGISTMRGPTGSGSIQPSLADFVTVGGIVSVERFQFLVWTILGVFSFLFLIGSQNPEQFHALPSVPDGFLYLMGVSSGGYLGGKLARKPGPVVDTISGKTTQPVAEAVGTSLGAPQSVSLAIKGRGLSTAARIQLQGRDVTFDVIPRRTALAEAAAAVPPKDADLVVLAEDPQAKDPMLASELLLTLRHPEAWLRSQGLDATLFDPASQTKPTLRLTNPDGQMSEWICELRAG
jgi:hypothetical protein